MDLQPISRRSVPDEVFERLLAEMVQGTLSPGEPLPSERKLAEALGVSRPAVREALQRMAQAKLVDVRQGESTTVLDYRKHAGLDLLPRLLMPGDDIDVSVVRSIMEARLHIAPKIAELAAERSGSKLADRLGAAIAELESDDDPVRRQHRALDFWDLLVEGASSIVFRLMFNGLRAAYLPTMEALTAVMAAEVDRVDAYRALADAVTAGDARKARELAVDLLTPATERMFTALRQLEQS